MRNIDSYNVEELSLNQKINLNGGGPIVDAISWYFKTLGSTFHGIWDGISGNERKI